MNLDRAEVLAPATTPQNRPALFRLVAATLLWAAFALSAQRAEASLVPLSEITASGDFCQSCPFASRPRRSVDGKTTTFWHGTNDLEVGDVNILVYRFDRFVMLTTVGLFMMNRQERWELGELDIQVSQDTSDGFGGTWGTIAHLPGNTPDTSSRSASPR